MTQMLTYQGRSLDITNPNAADIDPRDIAHALSHQCRFNGHAKNFYSVAQHACMVADLVLPEHRLAALLHYAPSAYLGHLIEPLKRCLLFYRDLDELHWVRICERFQLNKALPKVIQSADLIVTATEQRDLMPQASASWVGFAGVEPLNITIRPWNAQKARIVYLQKLLDHLEIRRCAVQKQQRPPDEEAIPGATSNQAQELPKGFSAAEIKRTPRLNTLRHTVEPEGKLNDPNRPPAQPVQGFKACPHPGPYRRVPNRDAVMPTLPPAHTTSWEEMLICAEIPLTEMTADLALPEAIHHEVTKRDRRRIE